jgi:anti-sigma factor ChrR (cupin superfamily)
MKCTDLQDMAAALAAGALNRADAGRAEALAAHDADAASEIAALHDAAAAMAAATTALKPAPARVREAVLRRAASTVQARPPEDGEVSEGFTFRKAGEGHWIQCPYPGMKIKLLATNRDTGYQTMLLDLAPGAEIPDHDHGGCEDIYVLSGDLVTEGRTLGPGDSIHGAAGSHHHRLFSPNGCMALMTFLPARAA